MWISGESFDDHPGARNDEMMGMRQTTLKTYQQDSFTLPHFLAQVETILDGMVQSNRQTTKHKSKRLNKKRRAEKAENTIKHNIALIQKSNRLISNLDVYKILYEAEVNKSSSGATTNRNNDHKMRPVCTQSLLLPTELNCADLDKHKLKKIGLFSCYCCDNYRADKFCKLKENKQNLVNQKKYGC